MQLEVKSHKHCLAVAMRKMESEMNKNTVCQRKSGSGWEDISVKDAISLGASEPLRCPECLGSVKVHRAGKTASAPIHYEHDESHHGCSHSMGFDGTPRTHPNPSL
jgi:hypothetical protein